MIFLIPGFQGYFEEFLNTGININLHTNNDDKFIFCFFFCYNIKLLVNISYNIVIYLGNFVHIYNRFNQIVASKNYVYIV